MVTTGDVHPAGGTPLPCCPGMRTVPAQPNSENVVARVTVAPSPKCATAFDAKM